MKHIPRPLALLAVALLLWGVIGLVACASCSRSEAFRTKRDRLVAPIPTTEYALETTCESTDSRGVTTRTSYVRVIRP